MEFVDTIELFETIVPPVLFVISLINLIQAFKLKKNTKIKVLLSIVVVATGIASLQLIYLIVVFIGFGFLGWEITF